MSFSKSYDTNLGGLYSNKLANTKAFYEEAFLDYYYQLWSNTNVNSTTANELAYLHSLIIFATDNIYTENERRVLLYNYCKPFMSTKSTSSLTRSIPSLPTSNLYILQALKEYCQLYINPPSRTIIGKDEELLSELIEKSDYNYTLSKVHRLAKLASRCLVRPYFNLDDFWGEKGLEYEVVSADDYAWNINSNGDKELFIHKTYIDDNNLKKDCFHVWTKNSFHIYDTNNIEVEKDKTVNGNPYNFIPYIELQLNVNLNTDNDNLFELVKAQLDYNKTTLLSNNNAIQTGFSAITLFNCNIDPATDLGSGLIISKENVSSDSGLIEPTINYINPPSNFLDLNSYAEQNIKKTLRSLGLPNSMIEEGANLQSGIALQLDRIGLLEVRQEDRQKMKAFDSKLVSLVARIANIEMGYNFDTKYDVQIEYIEVDYPADEAENFALATDKFKSGIIDLKNYILSTTNIDDIGDNDEAFKYIEANIRMLERLDELNKTITPPATEEDVMVDEEDVNLDETIDLNNM